MSRIAKKFFYCSLLWLWVATAHASSKIAYVAYTDGYWQVWTMHEDGSHQQLISKTPYDKTKPSWFPDGIRLLVNDPLGNLMILNIQDGTEKRVEIPIDRANADAVLSPDGRQVAFSHNPSAMGDGHDIWIANIDGTGALRLTDMPWVQREPAWHPDGNIIYFLSGGGESGALDIWLVNVTGRQRKQLTVNALYNADVAVSARDAMAFSSNRSGSYDIWIREADGAEYNLTQDEAYDANPAWAPDGDHLVFVSTREGTRPQVWQYTFSTKSYNRLTSHPKGARNPVYWQGAMP